MKVSTEDYELGEESDTPKVDAIIQYLEDTRWQELDRHDKTRAWSLPQRHTETVVVLPVPGLYGDEPQRITEALRVLSWVEKRTIAEIVQDINTGGVDGVSVRLHPEAPTGQAPLGFLKTVVPALRDYVAASASASLLRRPTLVLPARRPAEAEAYADQVRVSTQPGSIVLSLTLPLHLGKEASPPPIPFGRKVQLRMASAAERALELAEEVRAGRERIDIFAGGDGSALNATELASLALLGGESYSPYEMRFSRSPRFVSASPPAVISVTPGQQRIVSEAADFLRTKQPRSGVTVVGLVVKASRVSNFGPGEIIIYGPDDDTGIQRRFSVEVSEANYVIALNAHENGFTIAATGDVEVTGDQRRLVRLSAFGIV